MRNNSFFTGHPPWLVHGLCLCLASSLPALAGESPRAVPQALIRNLLLGILSDVTTPGDLIVASSTNTPAESVDNAIDNTNATKYLNFDKTNTGFTVTPSAGYTVLSGLTLTSANDAPERDPASYTLEGSHDGSNYFLIASGPVPVFSARFQKNSILITNQAPFPQYRLLFPTIVNASIAAAMQIAEVELLGVSASPDTNAPVCVDSFFSPTNIIVSFSEPLDTNSLGSATYDLCCDPNCIAFCGATVLNVTLFSRTNLVLQIGGSGLAPGACVEISGLRDWAGNTNILCKACWPDFDPPNCIGASFLGANTLRVTFDEGLAAGSASNPANYQITNLTDQSAGPAVIGATLGPGPTNVILTVSPALEPITDYCVMVSGVEDLSSNAVSSCLSCLTVPAGCVTFHNTAANRVFDTDGMPLGGGGYRAQLYAGELPGSLVPLGPVATNFVAGVFDAGVVEIPFALPGEIVYMQVRVWELGCGTNYEAALAYLTAQPGASNCSVGASQMFTNSTGSLNMCADLDGLNSFQLYGDLVPRIGAPPDDEMVMTGGPATFCVEAAGAGPFYYQWRLNGVNLPGATNDCLTIPSVQLANGGSYSAIIYNDQGAVLSQKAFLTLQDVPTLQPSDHFFSRVGLGGRLEVQGSNTFATRAAGEPFHDGKFGTNSVWYTWRPSSNGVVTLDTRGSDFDTILAVYTGSTIVELSEVASDDDSGGNHTSLVQFNAHAGVDYQIAIDGLAGERGRFILHRVLEPGLTIPAIPRIGQPQSQTVDQGARATFSVMTTNSAASFLWFQDGVPLMGGTNDTLIIDPVQISDVGLYWARVTDGNGGIVFTRRASLEIGPNSAVHAMDKVAEFIPLPPIMPPALQILQHPESVSVPLGSNALFTVEATGVPPLLYQWRLDGNSIVNATNASLLLVNVNASYEGFYDVLVYDSVSNILSAPAQLTVLSNRFLVLNEWMSDNTSTLVDLDGEYGDWIEILNVTASSIDLSGFYITDNPANKTQFAFPLGSIISPGQYLVVWADSKNTGTITNQIHTNFRLNRQGEYLGIFDTTGQTIDEISPSYPPQTNDVSHGRWPDGGSDIYIMNPPTPGSANAPPSLLSASSLAKRSHSAGLHRAAGPDKPVSRGKGPDKVAKPAPQSLTEPSTFSGYFSVSAGSVGRQIYSSVTKTTDAGELNCSKPGGASAWFRFILEPKTPCLIHAASPFTSLDDKVLITVFDPANDPFMTAPPVACTDGERDSVEWSNNQAYSVEYLVAVDGFLGKDGRIHLNWWSGAAILSACGAGTSISVLFATPMGRSDLLVDPSNYWIRDSAGLDQIEVIEVVRTDDQTIVLRLESSLNPVKEYLLTLVESPTDEAGHVLPPDTTVEVDCHFNGLPHTPVGQATANVDAEGRLQISQIGPIGTDGVDIELGQAQFALIQLDGLDGTLPGESLTFETFGQVNGVPDQSLGILRASRATTGNLLNVEWSDPMNTGVEIAAFAEGLVVQRSLVAPSSTLQTVARVQGNVSGAVWAPMWITPTGAITRIAFEQPTILTLNGPAITADLLELTRSASSIAPEFLSHLTLLGSGLEQFFILQSELGMFDHPHLSLGQAVLEGTADGLKLSNINSESYHGVAVDFEVLNRLQPGTDRRGYELQFEPIPIFDKAELKLVTKSALVGPENQVLISELTIVTNELSLDFLRRSGESGAEEEHVTVWLQVSDDAGLETAVTMNSGSLGLLEPTDPAVRLVRCGSTPPLCLFLRFDGLVQLHTEDMTLTGSEFVFSTADAIAFGQSLLNLDLAGRNLSDVAILGASPLDDRVQVVRYEDGSLKLRWHGHGVLEKGAILGEAFSEHPGSSPYSISTAPGDPPAYFQVRRFMDP